MESLKKAKFSKTRTKFPFYVTWVDQNSTIDDDQQTPTVGNVSPQSGRNLHLFGFKMNRREGGNISITVVVPQEVLGSFKMPQPGDIIMIEEDRTYRGSIATYSYSLYNNLPEDSLGYSPVPQWGSFVGDYGHLRSHKDHNEQFKAEVNSNFVKKFIKSITGYRFRRFYESNLSSGKFVVRGDPVFDIDPALINLNQIIEDGVDLGYGGGNKSKQHEYPNPLNAPKQKNPDSDYQYKSFVYEPLPKGTGTGFGVSESDPKSNYFFDIDPSKFSGAFQPKEFKEVSFQLNNKNYMSYQPIMDKTYLNEKSFERELPAAEEYQVSLRGNNKLLIQDQKGDGEQLLITLKNQYDGQFTILHNGDKGQVRIRDHLGQGMMMEADPEHPRVISWTNARQQIEQGHVPNKGGYTHIRSGDQYGVPETSFGQFTSKPAKDIASNQEVLFLSSESIFGDINQKVSSSMKSYVSSQGQRPGFYFNNNTGNPLFRQNFSMVQNKTNLLESKHYLRYLTESIEEKITIDSLAQNVRKEYVLRSLLNRVVHTANASNFNKPYSKTTIRKNALLQNEFEMRGDDSYLKFYTNQILRAQLYLSPTEANLTKFNAAGAKSSELLMGDASVSFNQLKLYDAGVLTSSITQSAEVGISVSRFKELNINVGSDTQPGTINIGNTSSDINVRGNNINIDGSNNVISGTTDFQP